ncbi:MAG TPA: type VI secretion system accessory protein TagJ [Stellaceae bacterium]|nr:type VI secretion system accessory protein TagJ [Stellaceae bacterium]
MDAAELLRGGKLEEAVARLLDQIRADPANPKLRIFLFQLSCVTGAWERAKTQLEVAHQMDQGAMLMARVYGGAIACEAARRQAFTGEAAPTIFGDPQPWMAELYEALRLAARGEHGAASALRAKALEAAPPSTGRIDGEAFEWIADADSRLGPMLEAIVNGRYFWLPFMRLARIDIDAPSDLRDQVWMPVRFTLANSGETVGLIPTRYFGSEASPDPLIRLARKTEWVETAPDSFEGRGQRLLATDAGEFPLMDARSIEIDQQPPAGEHG